jgi:hypothetical protein
MSSSSPKVKAKRGILDVDDEPDYSKLDMIKCNQRDHKKSKFINKIKSG